MMGGRGERKADKVWCRKKEEEGGDVEEKKTIVAAEMVCFMFFAGLAYATAGLELEHVRFETSHTAFSDSAIPSRTHASTEVGLYGKSGLINKAR
jgi:hypothetical protein